MQSSKYYSGPTLVFPTLGQHYIAKCAETEEYLPDLPPEATVSADRPGGVEDNEPRQPSTPVSDDARPWRKHRQGKPTLKRAKQKRRVSSSLAKDTFAALEQFINLAACGESVDGEPKFRITKEMWALHARHKQGEQRLRYADGRVFEPWHIPAGFLKQIDVHDMIETTKKYYYTSSRKGHAMPYIDVDAHEEWQTDLDQTVKSIVDFLGNRNVFVVPSDRGANIFLKTFYGDARWQEVNESLERLQKALKAFTRTHLCTVEVKGKISVGTGDNEYGTLAKLPCYRNWSHERLEEFKQVPTHTLKWLEGAAKALEEKAPPAALEKPEVRVAKERAGSCPGVPFTEAEVAAIPDMLEQARDHSNYLYAMRHEPKKKSVKLERLDFAVALVILTFRRLYGVGDDRPEKENPQDWIEAIWNWGYRNQHWQRAWDNSRWTAIRNTLADCGFLNLVDETYWFDADHPGRGKAMQWELKPEFALSTYKEEKRNIHSGGVPLYQACRWRPELISLPLEDAEPDFLDAEQYLEALNQAYI